MTAYDVYIGQILNPDFDYSGKPEAWRQNIDLIWRVGGGMSLMLDVIALTKEPERTGRQVDWATWYAEMTVEELRAWTESRRDTDVKGWRPYAGAMLDGQGGERREFNPRDKLQGLQPDGRYALVAVEGI